MTTARASRRYATTHLLDDGAIGLEARVERDTHLSLKLWLRLLACSTQVEIEVRNRLRARFGISLARFDYLAQLHRQPEGLRMSTLSRYLMVSGGNVTALTDELEREGMVVREDDPDDRRSYRLRMTSAGRKAFERIAREHEQWIIELFAGLESGHKQQLYELLGRLRVQLAENQEASA